MTQDFDRARVDFLAGVQHFEAGHMQMAEQCFMASLAVLPQRVSTRVNLAATRLRLGRPLQALAELDAILAAEPEHLDAWCHHAVALADLGRDAESLASADHALAVDPDLAVAWYQRGHALDRLRHFAEALAAFQRVVQLQPARADAWFRLGQMQQRLGQPSAALQANDRVRALDPSHHEAWSQRGALLKALQRPDEAAAAFERAIDLGADAQLSRFFLGSLRQSAAPPSAPRAYVQSLFDDYADSFDEHLVGVLGYQAHRRLVAPLPGLHPGAFDAALDLGCGTGLCGPLLKPMVRCLDGVDLSQGMLDRAAALGVYDSLVQADLVQHLAHTDKRHDLVLAADVFIYVGELGPVFGGVMRVLRPGGWFCFSAEQAGDAQAVALTPELRYAHSLPYLQGLAQGHGLQLRQVLQQPIREHQSQSIAGLYLYLQRP
ncbi:MAG TPA: tetratricopeptide repeat protein [Rubrivivax sp.]|nr:tetratricopeptide repeat protein [Rubrivivax sp.]